MTDREVVPGCARVRTVLEKLPDVSGPGLVETGRYRDGLPEKKMQLVGISLLLILLSLGPGVTVTFLSIFNVPYICRKIRCDGKSGKFYKSF